MADRSISPGASREFSVFIAVAGDSPMFVKHAPDAGIRLLSAAFIGGCYVAIVVLGHIIHKIRWRTPISVGLFIWIVAVFGSGLSYFANW